MSASTDWYSLLDTDGAEHPITAEVLRSLNGHAEYRRTSRRLRTSLARLVELLDGAPKQLLLRHEEASNARTSLLVRTHFNLGVEHGQAEKLVREASMGAVRGEEQLEGNPPLSSVLAVWALAGAILEHTKRLGKLSNRT